MLEVLAQAGHWSLALVPVLVLLGVFVWLDAFKLMSLKEILLLLVLGGISAGLAWPVSGRLLDTLPIGFSHYNRFVAPWIEEAIKAAMMILLFRLNRIGYKLDAIISGFAIGAGFSVVENILYLLRYPDYGAGTWLVRGLGTAVMHGTTLALLAAIAHQVSEREDHKAAAEFEFHLWWFLPGYFLAVALHMTFNQFPERPLLAMMGAWLIAPIVIILILNFGTHEAERELKAEEAAHEKQLEILRSGGWPDNPSGRKIAALAERVDGETAKRIRRYWELHAFLVMEAEEALLEEEAGDVHVDKEQIRAAIAELAGLRRALGRSTVAAVKALLPFSRNDYWELSELKEKLNRR